MATLFTFCVRHAKPDYAKQAARAAFAEVDRIEALLSRFTEGSDVWRINNAPAGETVRISEECHACLIQAIELQRVTKGAFDVTIGEATDMAKENSTVRTPSPKLKAALARSAKAAVTLAPDILNVQIIRPGLSLDLGAIGKGFALDRARELLADWEIKHALLSAGDSSVLTIGSQTPREPAKPASTTSSSKTRKGGWSVNLSGNKQSTPISLHDCALGASGTAVLGRHIIDPRRGGQSYTHVRAWALAPNAAAADALSTAWMTMMPHEIEEALRELGKGHAAMTEDTNGRLHICRRTGTWTLIRKGHPLAWPPA